MAYPSADVVRDFCVSLRKGEKTLYPYGETKILYPKSLRGGQEITDHTFPYIFAMVVEYFISLLAAMHVQTNTAHTLMIDDGRREDC